MKYLALTAAFAFVLGGCQATESTGTGAPAPIPTATSSGTISSQSSPAAKSEKPEGVVYCGGKGIKRVIEYTTPTKSSPQNKWNVRVRIAETNVQTKKRSEREVRAMTAYSYFGRLKPPAHFEVALLLEDKGEMLVFRDGKKRWLEYGDYRYDQCN